MGCNGMDSHKERLYGLLNEIRCLIEQNETEDGTFRFDPLKAIIALDFVKTELEKSIAAQNAQKSQTD